MLRSALRLRVAGLLSILFSGLLSGVVGCTAGTGGLRVDADEPVDTREPAGVHGSGLPSGLLNVEIAGIYDARVQLRHGRYRGAPFVAGGASRPTLEILHTPQARGDLDGDGHAEWVTLLVESSGGSGTFIYLSVFSELVAGGLHNVATRLVGDRVHVTQLKVRNRRIEIELVERNAGRATGAPQTRVWQLADGGLADSRRVAGHLVYGHEMRTLQPCEGGEEVWVIDGTGGDLPGRYRGLRSAPYEPLFAEVTGALVSAPAGEFAAGHAQALLVVELLRLEREGFACRLDLEGSAFRALGTEPFWRADVNGNVLALRLPGAAPGRFDVRPDRRGDVRPHVTGRPTEHRWVGGTERAPKSLTLTAERCVDPMSGSVFAYRARLVLDGRVLQGCALTALPQR